MKKHLPILFILFAAISLASCKHDRNVYAIRDFSSSLQPYLRNVVSKGFAGFDASDNFIKEKTTDEELKKLCKCEHPVLRALAYSAILKRASVNHLDFINCHLDDTAMVAVDEGEWGINLHTVSDDMIQHARWKTKDDKCKTADLIVRKHNYLSSAYTGLSSLPPEEKYYNSIKEMVTRNAPYNRISYALFALAKYKKPGDISVIRDILLSHSYRLERVSFNLMSEYPDTAYLKVYQEYYPRRFYRNIRWERSNDNVIAFIESLATYKSKESAAILNEILTRQPFMPCDTDTSDLKRTLCYAIWNNPCPSYTALRTLVANDIKYFEERTICLPVEPATPYDNNDPEPIRWWN